LTRPAPALIIQHHIFKGQFFLAGGAQGGWIVRVRDGAVEVVYCTLQPTPGPLDEMITSTIA
jgi:hypothetical protein